VQTYVQFAAQKREGIISRVCTQVHRHGTNKMAVDDLYKTNIVKTHK